jgi:hypothetical protein
MSSTAATEALRSSDAAVVARYLQVRSFVNDRLLAHVEKVLQEKYQVVPTRRLVSTLTAHVHGGFVRPDGGEVWPVVFLTAVDVSVALCVQLSPEWLASLGTTLNGPQRMRHRLWEEWWGWEKGLGAVHPHFFDLPAGGQEEAVVAFYCEGLEWLVHNRLVSRK